MSVRGWERPAIPARLDASDRKAIEQFASIDRLFTIGGIAFLIVSNAFFIESALPWIILPCLVLLLGALTLASRLASNDGSVVAALGLITGGNWLVAIVISIVLPSLWPAMVLTVHMPLVLATPYLRRNQLMTVLVSTGVVVAVVTGLGAFRPDGGALNDLGSTFAHVAVTVALISHIPPIGLLIWQQNRRQAESLRQARDFNEQLRESRAELAASRRRVVQAGDIERRRIERELHEGPQQRLVTLGVRLRLLESQTTHMPDVNDAVNVLLDELRAAIGEVRELSKGIYPPLLQSEGLLHALNDVARRSTVPVRADLADVGRLHPSVETALYFTALEALTNAAKHAPSSLVEISLTDDGLRLCLSIVDDGPGFDLGSADNTEGVYRMDDRVSAVGGSLLIASELGVGTSVTAIVPKTRAISEKRNPSEVGTLSQPA